MSDNPYTVKDDGTIIDSKGNVVDTMSYVDIITSKIPELTDNTLEPLGLNVDIDSNYIAISDNTYQYISIKIDQWQQLKELIDSQLE